MSTAKFVIGYMGAGIILGLIIWLGLMLFMAYTKMDIMLSHLKNCSSVMARVPFINSGPLGKIFLLGQIMGVLAIPSVYLKNGTASADDINKFPVDLKRKLIILHHVGLGLLLVMLVLGIIAKLDLV